MNRRWQTSVGVVLALVYPMTVADALDARQIPKRAETHSFTAELSEVSPWCDHMPSSGPAQRRQYLIVKLTVTNHTDEPLQLSIIQAAISFDEQSQGQVVIGLSVRGENGLGTGQTTIIVSPQEEMVIDLRGDNLYDEGHHGQQLYLTLTLSSHAEQVMIRHSGSVLETS